MKPKSLVLASEANRMPLATGNAISPTGSAYGASLSGPAPAQQTTPQPPAGTGQWGYGQGMIRPDVQRGPQQQWVFQNGSYYGPNGQQMSPENYARMQGSGGSYGSSSSYSVTNPAGGDAFQAAKAANEARYAEGKQLYDERYGRNMGYLEGAGATEKAAIEQRGQEAKASTGQRLQSLGLSGTTIGQTLNAGIDRDVGTQYGALQERLNQQRLAADAGMSKDKIDFIERRNDIYPEAGSYSSSSSSAYGSASGGPQGQFGQRSATDGMAYIPPRAGDPMGRGTFVPRDPPPRQPTGVNLEYITPQALNDPAYMEAFQNTPMRNPPRLLNQRQQGRG